MDQTQVAWLAWILDEMVFTRFQRRELTQRRKMEQANGYRLRWSMVESISACSSRHLPSMSRQSRIHRHLTLIITLQIKSAVALNSPSSRSLALPSRSCRIWNHQFAYLACISRHRILRAALCFRNIEEISGRCQRFLEKYAHVIRSFDFPRKKCASYSWISVKGWSSTHDSSDTELTIGRWNELANTWTYRSKWAKQIKQTFLICIRIVRYIILRTNAHAATDKRLLLRQYNTDELQRKYAQSMVLKWGPASAEEVATVISNFATKTTTFTLTHILRDLALKPNIRPLEGIKSRHRFVYGWEGSSSGQNVVFCSHFREQKWIDSGFKGRSSSD
jgi:hypothetical protein